MTASELHLGDLCKLLDLTSDLGSIENLNDFPSRVVALMQNLLPADSYSYTEVNPLLGRMQGVIAPEDLLTPQGWEVFGELAHEHPVIDYYQRHDVGQALTISDFLSQRQFRDTALYREFYRHVDTEYQLACQLPVPQPLVIGLVFNRQHRDFNDRERQLLDQARPHLWRAYQYLELVARAKVLRGLLDGTEPHHGKGIILVSRLGVIMACNERALELCQRQLNGVLVVGGLLPAMLLSLVARLPQATTIETTVNGARLQLERLPSANKTEDAYLLCLTEQSLVEPLERFARLGLTPRQAEILSLLAQGHRNKVIARQLGIAPGTVKKHLDHIYARLEVDNRTAAVAVARRSAGLSDIG